MKKKITVYVDGFNLFHALDNRFKAKLNFLKWLDIKKMIQKEFLNAGQEELLNVYFFSAFPDHLSEDTQRTHTAYKKALESTGVVYVSGNFKGKKVICDNYKYNINRCSCRNCTGILFKNEEKESDVNLAIHIVKDAFMKTSNKVIVITNDSDISPAIRMAREINPDLKVLVLTPPLSEKNLLADEHAVPNWDLLESAGQYNVNNKGQKFRRTSEIMPAHVSRNLFPKIIQDSNGHTIVERPKKYDATVLDLLAKSRTPPASA